MPDLAAEGLNAERLCRLAARMSRDEDALRDAAQSTFIRLRLTADAVVLDGRLLAALPDAILIRVVDLALNEAGGGGVGRLERMERLVFEELRPALTAGTAMRRTLRGILVELGAEGVLSFSPAPARRSPILGTRSPFRRPACRRQARFTWQGRRHCLHCRHASA